MKKVLLLGGVIPAVHLLRKLISAGAQVDVIASNNDAISHSKYGSKYLFKNHIECEKAINTWISKNKNNRANIIIIPCSEIYLQYVRLFEEVGFDFFGLSEKKLKVLANKKLFYTWLIEIGINVGEFYDLDQKLCFENGQSYIVKISKNCTDYDSPFKTKIIKSKRELDFIVKSIPSQFHSNFVVQKLSKDNKSISYGGVWVDGVEIASVIVEQVRQYPKGVTSSACLLEDSEDIIVVKNTLGTISKKIKLNGFIELEFIKAENSLIPIDLNPRLWGWSNFLFSNYPKLERNIIFKGSDHPEQVLKKNWTNLWRDIPAIFYQDLVLSKKFKMLFESLKSEHFDFICWKDIKPEFISLIKKVV